MQVLSVLAHPRRGSLTGAAFDRLNAGLRAGGHGVTEADLTAEGFDPRLGPEDEPDWNDATKLYSPAVRREMERIRAHQGIVMTFPVWWWSVPALLKGWIDRVWNRGFAYDGSENLSRHKALMVGVAAGGAKTYDGARGYRAAMETQLTQGVLDYCGIAGGRLALLLNSTGEAAARVRLLDQAEALGKGFPS
jgi:NAD(P)H dehydrogenase (quinone)